MTDILEALGWGAAAFGGALLVGNRTAAVRRRRRWRAAWKERAGPRSGPYRRALDRRSGRCGGRHRGDRHGAAGRWGPLTAGLAAGGLIAVLIGGVAGLVVGGLIGAALGRSLPKARSAAERLAEQEEEQLARQLPLTAELLAACLGSSASPSAAVAAVARSVDAPMGPVLAAISAELALGAPPEVCWARVGEQHPVLAPLARCLVRTSLSGAPVGGPLTDLAQGQRAAATRAAHARVRRAGVLAVAPLGLCFLPAFVLIGVAPVVLGLTDAFGQHL
ncbi:type II secretion system F family protein [Kitasatospora sp. NPDC054939]